MQSRLAYVEASLEVAKQSQAIFTTLYPESAIAAAVYADNIRALKMPAVSPLAGLPISIKDLLDVAGEPTLAGSTVLKSAPPATEDAPVVRRLRQAGAAIIGKTNMTEFAYSGVGINPHYGTAPNPADTTTARIPGGSSSGAAVSVATGLCVAAIGSDTGGSIRIPAALCGLTGFKPTANRVARSGAIPLSFTLDTICAMAHTVDDCILMDHLIAEQPIRVPELALKGLRLAVPQTLFLDDMDRHVSSAFSRALSYLSAAGAHIIETPMQLLAEYRSMAMFSAPEAYAWHRHLLAERFAEYDPRVAQRIQLGAKVSAADYIDMHKARTEWIAHMEMALAPYDAILMPTVPIVAPEIAPLIASDDAFFQANGLLLRNTASINILDGCAISLPCHEQGSLPVGLSIAGVADADARILAIARVVENALSALKAA
ncbi:amidase [Undibacterium sp. Jales W-56]|nr:amidase [Undibacterium sp. Jales W-56]MCU6433229.1 amidase [Undibacterium sp. Jales W-56]